MSIDLKKFCSPVSRLGQSAAGRLIVVLSLISLCPLLGLANIPVPDVLLTSVSLTIPASPSGPESAVFSAPVSLIAGQTYWVGILPDSDSGAFWAQNPNLGESVAFSFDGANWQDSGFGPTAYPGEFDVIGSSNNVLYTDLAADPFTGHVWAIAGSNANPVCSPNCYGTYASYFTPSVSDNATSIDVVLQLNSFTDGDGNQVTYGPNVSVGLFTSTANVATPEPGVAWTLALGLAMTLALRYHLRKSQSAR